MTTSKRKPAKKRGVAERTYKAKTKAKSKRFKMAGKMWTASSWESDRAGDYKRSKEGETMRRRGAEERITRATALRTRRARRKKNA